MLNALYGYLFNAEDAPQPEVVPEARDNIVEDGWVNYQENIEEFDIVESPEIMEMTDEIVVAKKTSSEQLEAVKRREIVKKAKAKTALRNHLESVMFLDPVSGKDVRKHKHPHGSNSSAVSSASGNIRRQSTQTQRSKNSSGKSNDRKVHVLRDIQTYED